MLLAQPCLKCEEHINRLIKSMIASLDYAIVEARFLTGTRNLIRYTFIHSEWECRPCKRSYILLDKMDHKVKPLHGHKEEKGKNQSNQFRRIPRL
jgi:hypothetical protein